LTASKARRSWCADECGRDGFTDLLLNDGRVVRGASSETEGGEESSQVVERGARDLRRTGDHAGADDGIEHPGRDRDHRAGGCLDMDELTGPAPFTVERANALFEEGMPTIVDDDVPPGMGRITR
jgi:hypothetical protein